MDSITVSRPIQIMDQGVEYAFTPGDYTVAADAKPEDFRDRKITPALADHWMVKGNIQEPAQAATVGMPEDATLENSAPVRPVVTEGDVQSADPVSDATDTSKKRPRASE